MKYKIEGTTIEIQYERKDKIWKDFLEMKNPSEPFVQEVHKALKETYEDQVAVYEAADQSNVILSMPDTLPDSRLQRRLYRIIRKQPIHTASFETIKVWYEPDPSINFGGFRKTIKNNGRSKLELMVAYLNNEEVID